MLVYFKETIFGRQIVSEIKRHPQGCSIIFNNSKPMHYEQVESLLTIKEKRDYNLILGWID